MISNIPKNLLFRYKIPCKHLSEKPKEDSLLPEAYRLEFFGLFDKQPNFADLRVGWRPEGVYLSLQVAGKKQAPRCRETHLHESDCLQIWLDTRATHDVHRATKFCHWMAFMPSGGGPQQQLPVARMLKINRCKEPSPAMNRAKLMVNSKVENAGYWLTGFIPKESLYGWDTVDHRQLGFNYAVIDNELGWQSLAIGAELPVAEDPSLWQTLVLVDG